MSLAFNIRGYGGVLGYIIYIKYKYVDMVIKKKKKIVKVMNLLGIKKKKKKGFMWLVGNPLLSCIFQTAMTA